MKKYLLVILTILVLLACDKVNKTGPLTWTLENGVLTISGQGAMPNYTNTTPWRKKADESNQIITNIFIEEGVTSIGDNAFKDLNSVVFVSIPSTLNNIGNYAFSGCTSLISIKIPEGVLNIGGFAFKNCSKLIQIEIPDSVIKIGAFAFQGCESLLNISLGKNLQLIDEGAFSSCANIKTITSNNPIPPVTYSRFFTDINLHNQKCRLIVPFDFINEYKEHMSWRLYIRDNEEIKDENRITNPLEYFYSSENTNENESRPSNPWDFLDSENTNEKEIGSRQL